MTQSPTRRDADTLPSRKAWYSTAAIVALVLAVYSIVPPVYQDETYHRFADSRTFLGVPNALNVLSNGLFVVAGLLGLRKLFDGGMESRESALPWTVFFGGNILIAVGSAYYHLHPCDDSLFWDRLPMTWTFVGLAAGALALHFRFYSTWKGLGLLLVLGTASVLTWHLSSRPGGGDLRFYGLVQFGACAVAGAGFLTSDLDGRRKGWILVSGLLYGISKVFECSDAAVFDLLGGFVSGHTLKHLFAALAVGCYIHILMEQRREPGPRKHLKFHRLVG